MDDDIDDKDDTKRYVFFMMNKFHVYLLKLSGVKDGEIKWSCYISLFKRKNHNLHFRTPEMYVTEVLRNCISSYGRCMSRKPVLQFGCMDGNLTCVQLCKEAPE